jgi:hypothetical protein
LEHKQLLGINITHKENEEREERRIEEMGIFI